MAFIVLTFGAAQGSIKVAVAGAAAALAVVVVTGVVLREPLARVPENALKFAVGVLLTAFGIFWGAEGAGVSWPGGDAAIPVVVLAVGAYSLLSVAVLRRPTASSVSRAP